MISFSEKSSPNLTQSPDTDNFTNPRQRQAEIRLRAGAAFRGRDISAVVKPAMPEGRNRLRNRANKDEDKGLSE